MADESMYILERLLLEQGDLNDRSLKIRSDVAERTEDEELSFVRSSASSQFAAQVSPNLVTMSLQWFCRTAVSMTFGILCRCRELRMLYSVVKWRRDTMADSETKIDGIAV